MNWALVDRSTPAKTSNNSNLDPSEQDGEAMTVTMAMAAPTDSPIPRPSMTATILFYAFAMLFGYVSEINKNKCELENVNSGNLCNGYEYPPPAPVNILTPRPRQSRPSNGLKFIVILLEYAFGNETQGSENEIGLELEFKNVNCYLIFVIIIVQGVVDLLHMDIIINQQQHQ